MRFNDKTLSPSHPFVRADVTIVDLYRLVYSGSNLVVVLPLLLYYYLLIMLPAFLHTFCPLSRVAASLPIIAPGLEHWTVHRYGTAAELREHWPETSHKGDFWISSEVMAFLADHPQGLTTEAIMLEDSRDFKHVLLTAQTFSFSAAGQVSDVAGGKTSKWNFRRRLLAPFSFKMLCLGQFLTSGDYASDGLNQLNAQEEAKLLPAVAETLMRCSPGYAAYLIKDIYPSDHLAVGALQRNQHYLLPADPVMSIALNPEWTSTEDYLAALTSKYRVRYRRARSKMVGITRRRLCPEEVAERQDRIYELYRDVSSGADFNAASLTPNYFQWLAKARRPKARLENVFAGYGMLGEIEEENNLTPVFQGYFNEAGELIGYTTAIPNGGTLHAHFLGLENSYKCSHHLYHNMLFDLLEDAIAGDFHVLDYGRTALEIKSSIGATATDFAVLVKARYGWLNRLIPLFTPAVYTASKWVPRNPFK